MDVSFENCGKRLESNVNYFNINTFGPITQFLGSIIFIPFLLDIALNTVFVFCHKKANLEVEFSLIARLLVFRVFQVASWDIQSRIAFSKMCLDS